MERMHSKKARAQGAWMARWRWGALLVLAGSCTTPDEPSREGVVGIAVCEAPSSPQAVARAPREVFEQATSDMDVPTAAVQSGDDESGSWRTWWAANEDAYANLKAKVHSGAVATGADTFFLGKGVGGGGAPVGPGAPSGPGVSKRSGATSGNRVAGATAALSGGSRPSPRSQPSVGSSTFHGGQRVGPDRSRPSRLEDCLRRPAESPAGMYFRFWGDNAFELAELDALSTFSVDVDTASYALARRYLSSGLVPERAQIRTEEFLNYFRPDVPSPEVETFAVRTELAPSRFAGSEDHRMLRIGIRGREVPCAGRQALSLTLVIDTSGSMSSGGRLDLVKYAVGLLLYELDERDEVAIVAYSNTARVVLPSTSALHRSRIEAALDSLSPSGGTNAEAGLRLGYEIAAARIRANQVSRVVFLSDGVANIGARYHDSIRSRVAHYREEGVLLNTIGVGMGNHNDAFLEQLADGGDGVCDYVDTRRAARRALVERFVGAFEPVARDVKVQVEFDPLQVHRYRLLGYENRAIADSDFRNDAVDAGEVGSGHQVVALYELQLGSRVSGDRPLATVRLRWKDPVLGADAAEPAQERVHFVFGSSARAAFDDATAGYRRSVIVAQFAELLRRSTHARGDSLTDLLRCAERLAPELSDPDFNEFVAMVRIAERMGLDPVEGTALEQRLDEYRRIQVLRSELDDLNRDLDPSVLRGLERRALALEAELSALIEGR